MKQYIKKTNNSKRGRPKIAIDETEFEKLCAFQCTEEEIASWYKCSIDTIERWCFNKYKTNFADIYKKFSAKGKISLRRTQFRIAETNPSMAIWLGKQYLGQQDPEKLEQKSGNIVDDFINSLQEKQNGKD